MIKFISLGVSALLLASCTNTYHGDFYHYKNTCGYIVQIEDNSSKLTSLIELEQTSLIYIGFSPYGWKDGTYGGAIERLNEFGTDTAFTITNVKNNNSKTISKNELSKYLNADNMKITGNAIHWYIDTTDFCPKN